MKKTSSAISRARSLRKSMTPEEVKLWVQLKALNARGFHFRKQAPLDGYIPDFAEFGHRLIIEVDGSQHGLPSGESLDAKRDAHFRASGFRILRFWNRDINTNMDGVMLTIEEALQDTPSGPSGHLPRRKGRRV
jgi:very-short-patch-repair endonuclease